VPALQLCQSRRVTSCNSVQEDLVGEWAEHKSP
jgi:hypothetical protein